MSIKLMSEVWEHAPVGGGDLLLLLRLADASSDSTRMSWESTATLATRTRMSQRNVFVCLANLAKAGLIESVSKAEAPSESHRYKSTVRRITERETWGEDESVTAITLQQKREQFRRLRENYWGTLMERDGERCAMCGLAEPRKLTLDHIQPLSKGGTNDLSNVQILCGSCNSKKGSSAGMQDEHMQNLHMQPVSPNPSSSTTSSKASRSTSYFSPTRPGRVKIEKQADDDPQSVAIAGLDLPARDEVPDRKRKSTLDDPLEQRTRPKRPSSPAVALVDYFALLASAAPDTVPGEVNREALRGTFGRWLSEGHTRPQISQMIARYWSPNFQRSPSVISWQDFLAKRGQLSAEAGRKIKAEQMEADRFDLSRW